MFKIRFNGRYFKKAYRNSEFIPDVVRSESYTSWNSAMSAVRGFLQPNSTAFRRLQEELGRDPTVEDLEIVEFELVEVGAAIASSI